MIIQVLIINMENLTQKGDMFNVVDNRVIEIRKCPKKEECALACQLG